jgi:hypothetical protein
MPSRVAGHKNQRGHLTFPVLIAQTSPVLLAPRQLPYKGGDLLGRREKLAQAGLSLVAPISRHPGVAYRHGGVDFRIFGWRERV